MNEQYNGRGYFRQNWWPTPGNVLFTLLAIAVYGLTQQSWAGLAEERLQPAVPSTLNYQGRLTQSNGLPVNEVVELEFAIYDSLEGGLRVWGPELHPAVGVVDGLFQVSLGSSMVITPAVWGDGERYLQITVNGEPLTPRELIRSTPTTQVAGLALTVPDGAIGTNQIADGAITPNKAPLLLQSANGTEQIIKSGVDIITINGVGEGIIPFNYTFPNRVTSFIAINGNVFRSC